MGAVDSTNLYAFVGWQPNMGVDPLGQAVVILWYGKGSYYGAGEGFDELADELQEDVEARGGGYRTVSVSDFNLAENQVQIQSKNFTGSQDDLKIYAVSGAEAYPVEAWDFLVQEIQETRAPGEKLVLVGHSRGAVQQERLAKRLKDVGQSVSGFVSVDRYGTSPSAIFHTIPDNVVQFLGFYSDPTKEMKERRAKEGAPHLPGSGAESFDVAPKTINYGVLPVNETHQSIDSSPLVHDMVRALIEGKPLLPMIFRTYKVGLQGPTIDQPPTQVPPEQ